jgi:hypothetical protein
MLETRGREMCSIEKQGEGKCVGSRNKGKGDVQDRETRGREMCRIEKQGEGRCVVSRNKGKRDV